MMPVFLLISVLSMLFDLIGKKEKWESQGATSFECGYTSYFFSRFSFSIHYYIVGLIFLFLDLELCMLMPFFLDEFHSIKGLFSLSMLLLSLLLGLLEEWRNGKLEWVY